MRYSLLAEHCGLEPDEVPGLLEQAGSMRAMIEALGTGGRRTLRRFELEETGTVEQALAESALLDPEKPAELFEPFAKGGLFRKRMHLSRIRNRLKRKAA
jgi:putative ubiquitin-RnfH superfamily antitoxin RatB of RatAB toxin-antitoxin module